MAEYKFIQQIDTKGLEDFIKEEHLIEYASEVVHRHGSKRIYISLNDWIFIYVRDKCVWQGYTTDVSEAIEFYNNVK